MTYNEQRGIQYFLGAVDDQRDEEGWRPFYGSMSVNLARTLADQVRIVHQSHYYDKNNTLIHDPKKARILHVLDKWREQYTAAEPSWANEKEMVFELMCAIIGDQR